MGRLDALRWQLLGRGSGVWILHFRNLCVLLPAPWQATLRLKTDARFFWLGWAGMENRKGDTALNSLLTNGSNNSWTLLGWN